MDFDAIKKFAADVEADCDNTIASLNTAIDMMTNVKIGVAALVDALVEEPAPPPPPMRFCPARRSAASRTGIE